MFQLYCATKKVLTVSSLLTQATSLAIGSAAVDYDLHVSGLTLPAEVHRPSLGSRRDSPGVGLRCLQLPLTSTELGGLPALSAQRIPDPQFPTKTPAGRRSSCPVPSYAPGGQPDPTPRAGTASVDQLRWARCPDDERLPLLTDAVEHASLPVRSPGAHLHRLLRRPPVTGGLCPHPGGSGGPLPR